MQLFAGLRKIREFEKGQLPFIKSVLDFDIIIEIGYQEERSRPKSLKQLYHRWTWYADSALDAELR